MFYFNLSLLLLLLVRHIIEKELKQLRRCLRGSKISVVKEKSLSGASSSAPAPAPAAAPTPAPAPAPASAEEDRQRQRKEDAVPSLENAVDHKQQSTLATLFDVEALLKPLSIDEMSTIDSVWKCSVFLV